MSVSGMHSGEKGEAAGKLLEPGDMFGDYTVEKLLGKGGMGAVYLVRAPGGELYAVKVMFPDMVKKGSDYRKRFAREAEFAMKIRHDNLISVYDVGEDPETGLCYIIMEYVPGGSVADRLEREGPFPMSDAVAIAAQVAMALEVAHRHGVIHRDIKPDNIMFDADGTPKLADLGVAKFTDGAHKTTVTTTGMIIGTPAYMAPEQMMDSHHIDARADIYALGVVLYEMLTGKRPNEGSTAVELLAKAIKGEPLPDVRTMRPEVSAAIAHVLSLMCAPKPEGRPATALEAAQLLQKAATGRLVLPKKPPRAADAAARKRKSRFPFAAIAVVAGIVAICVMVVVASLSKLSAERQPQSQIVVVTNVVERKVVVTNQLGQAMHEVKDAIGEANGKTSESAFDGNKDATAVVPYVSKSRLHALYRSKDRKHVFVSSSSHAQSGGEFTTPPYSLARIKELISQKVEIVHFNVSCSKDGILFSSKRYGIEHVSNGRGNARDYTAQDLKQFKVKQQGTVSTEGFATCEEILREGKGKILFDISGGMDYARELEALIDRLDAWESVILEGFDVKEARRRYGEGIWRKIRSGEVQIMVGDRRLADWRSVTPECMIWGHNLDLAERGVTNIPERITCAFDNQPGPGLRTDDEKGWAKAISEGVTILRTNRPVALRRYIEKTSSPHDSASAAELMGPYGASQNGSANPAVVPYVSKSDLHAAYRSKDRTRVFVEVCHVHDDDTFSTPRCTVDRVKEAISDRADILQLRLTCSKDGVLFSAERENLENISTGTGAFADYTSKQLRQIKVKQHGQPTTKSFATLEDMLKNGKGKILFKISGACDYAKELEKLLDRLDAWESVILETWGGVDEMRQKYGEAIWRRIRTGEAQIMVVDACNFNAFRNVTPECSVWGWHIDLEANGLKGISQRIDIGFVYGLGEANRTDDEVGWEKALKDGATVFRTNRPVELGKFLKKRNGMRNDNEVGGAQTQDNLEAAASTVVLLPCADPKETGWKSRKPWRYVTKYPLPSGGRKWMEPAFRDSSWKRTNKPFGSGKSKELMRIADRWSSSSLYLRRHFARKGGKVARVEFTLYHACNVKIYLNGDLVLDKVDRNDWWEKIEIPVEAFEAALRDGDNVLAVEAQDNFGVRYFDCGLTVEVEESK